jgi:hypothetical protein
MKLLFIATAVIEAGAGVALALAPSMVVSLLLGTPLDTTAGLTIARIAGAALCSLGIACWLARNDDRSRVASGLMAAMSLYNAATSAVLAHAGFGIGLVGIALWPGVLLHTAMAVWCLVCLGGKWSDLVK